MTTMQTARSASMDDTSQRTITICGKRLLADESGALYWPAERTMIVADLHLEKGSSRADRGALLPPYDTRATLIRLAEAIDRYDPGRVISLGDGIHDTGAADRIADDDRQALEIMQEGRSWIWIRGNHDPEVPRSLGGTMAKELLLGGLAFRHEPYRGPMTHEVAAHMHPAARLSMHGYAIRRPCFVGNGMRLIMPAFGAYTGGLNVLEDAFAPYFGGEGVQVWMLGQEGVYPVAARQLRSE
jgi:DNA ligase-associated metallophosphoesterase